MPGLPKSYIKKWGVTKLAWKKFRAKALSKSRGRKTSRRKNNPRKKNVRRMAKKKRRRGGKSMIQTAFKFIRLGALVAPHIHTATQPQPLQWKITTALSQLTGYNIEHGTFHPEELAKGWGPYVMACLTTYGIPKLTSIIRRL